MTDVAAAVRRIDEDAFGGTPGGVGARRRLTGPAHGHNVPAMYRLARAWAFGFVAAGHAILVVALLVAIGVVVSPAMLEPQIPGLTLPLRVGLGAMILAGGLLVAGLLVLAGQRLLVSLDQRRLLERILREVRRREISPAEEPPARPPLGDRIGRRL